MMQSFTEVKKILIGRLKKGDDILSSLTMIISQNNINTGVIFGIGAVEKATVGFYLHSEGTYKKITFNEQMEIVSLTGNISLRDENPFIHAHIILGNSNGECFGGHLMLDTIAFAFEYKIFILNMALKRDFDEETGLYLWKESKAI